MKVVVCCLALAVAVAACSSGAATPTLRPSGSPSASPSADPSASPAPTPKGPLTLPQLKYQLMDRLGRPWFCDPDYYPIARQDERQLAIERFGEVQDDADAFTAILDWLGLDAEPDAAFPDEQKLAIYREWKTLNAILLENAPGTRYRFDLLTVPPPDAIQGTRTAGTIDELGVIEIEQQAPEGEPPCPICLAPGTLIDTPAGPQSVESLRIGSPIWTVDATGRRVAAAVAEIGSVRVPASHRFVHLVLDDGRELFASPGHPLADGRMLGELAIGDVIDGARVVSADRVASGPATYDILPSGATGAYVANGIPLRSTIGP